MTEQAYRLTLQEVQINPALAELIEALREGSDQAKKQSGLLAQAAYALETLGEQLEVFEEIEQYSQMEVRP